MMTTLTTPCTICANKSIGIFKCEGCTKVFCRKHVNEHRDDLRQQLDEIIHEHDQLHQLINQTENEYHSLFDQITQWKEKAIEKIHQVTEKIRADIIEQIQAQKESNLQTLKYLSRRLRKACEDDDYIENDLHTWTTTLQDLKRDLPTNNSSLTLNEDSNVTLISNINLISTKHLTFSNEYFLRFIGDIDIEDNGLVAIHDIRKSSDAFVYGKQSYHQGKHTIRFLITKTNANYITTFGIASVQAQLCVYGWNSDDQIVGRHHSHSEYLYNQYDMKGETILEIELYIDCEQRKLSYLNQRTQCVKEIHVDLNLCPFPWQLYFYLYDIGDRVRLLTSNRI
ncbi:hypothetical protein I4U23_001235 [Adineta vaga]|nr:hypothetical protein I4U23_001235 [Adineta vaga]